MEDVVERELPHQGQENAEEVLLPRRPLPHPAPLHQHAQDFQQLHPRHPQPHPSLRDGLPQLAESPFHEEGEGGVELEVVGVGGVGGEEDVDDGDCVGGDEFLLAEDVGDGGGEELGDGGVVLGEFLNRHDRLQVQVDLFEDFPHAGGQVAEALHACTAT